MWCGPGRPYDTTPNPLLRAVWSRFGNIYRIAELLDLGGRGSRELPYVGRVVPSALTIGRSGADGGGGRTESTQLTMARYTRFRHRHPTPVQVVFNCLETLAAAPDGRGLGIVENAVMLGTPIGTKRGR